VLQHTKAKIVQLYIARLQQILADNNAAERIEGEQPTLYNVLQMRRRRNVRIIIALRDPEGITKTTPRGIARTLATYLMRKYARIEVNTGCIQRLLEVIKVDPTNQDMDALIAPFTTEEIEHAIRTGGRKKVPGRDGLTR
jgi:hypothetical protein